MARSGKIRRSNKDNTPLFWKRPRKREVKVKTELISVSDKTYTLITVPLKSK
jgi:hypothetical protein